jgi:hypothetical protein
LIRCGSAGDSWQSRGRILHAAPAPGVAQQHARRFSQRIEIGVTAPLIVIDEFCPPQVAFHDGYDLFRDVENENVVAFSSHLMRSTWRSSR